MYVVTVEFALHREHAHAFIERVRRQAADSLEQEPGCQVFDVCTDPLDPDRVFLYEVYLDRGAFDRHLESGHFKAFDTDVRDWVRDKKVRTYHRLS